MHNALNGFEWMYDRHVSLFQEPVGCSLCHYLGIIFAQVTTNSCSRTIDNTLPMLGFHDHFRWKMQDWAS